MKSKELQEIVGSLPKRVTDVLQPGAEVVVTGCAGFIGSTVTEALLELGCRVTGVDCLTDYYDVNLILGVERARSVTAWLAAMGVAEDRIMIQGSDRGAQRSGSRVVKAIELELGGVEP